MKRFKSIIFGGSGFIGTRLINSLNNNGSDIICFDLVDNERTEYEYIQGDVREKIDIEINNDNSITFNLAVVHVTPGHEFSEYFETNIKGAKNVCNFARKNDIKTIVFTSSIAPYHTSDQQKAKKRFTLPNIAY